MLSNRSTFLIELISENINIWSIKLRQKRQFNFFGNHIYELKRWHDTNISTYIYMCVYNVHEVNSFQASQSSVTAVPRRRSPLRGEEKLV